MGNPASQTYSTFQRPIQHRFKTSSVVQERDGWFDCVYLALKKAAAQVPNQKLVCGLEKRDVLYLLSTRIEDHLSNRVKYDSRKKIDWRSVKIRIVYSYAFVLALVILMLYVIDLTNDI